MNKTNGLRTGQHLGGTNTDIIDRFSRRVQTTHMHTVIEYYSNFSQSYR